MLIIFFLQNSTFPWPSGWAVVGWVVAAIVALIYLYSGVLHNISKGRKDLLELGEKKLNTAIKEKEELEYKVKQLEEDIETLEKEKADIERDKTMLLRDHRQILEMSVADLKMLQKHIKVIEQLEIEINRYREEKGLPPRTPYINDKNE